MLYISDCETIDISYKPSLYDIHRYFENYQFRGENKRVVGNHEVRMILPLLFPLQKVSVVVKGAAG